MKRIRYKAKVLPDGHLPLPKEWAAHEGDEVEVTITPAKAANGEAQAKKRADHVLKRWAGVGRGSGASVAERHDDFLYGR